MSLLDFFLQIFYENSRIFSKIIVDLVFCKNKSDLFIDKFYRNPRLLIILYTSRRPSTLNSLALPGSLGLRQSLALD